MSNATLPTRTGGIRRRSWFIGQSVTAYTPLAKSKTMPFRSPLGSEHAYPVKRAYAAASVT